MTFDIQVSVDEAFLPCKIFKFSGGEIQVKLDETKLFSSIGGVRIYAHLKSADDIMALLLVTDAIRQAHGTVPISLDLPYIPYARQDRVCETGESLAIKVFANLINSQNYFEVFVMDPHSDVSVALINNCNVIQQYQGLKNINQNWENAVFVSPDAGATKKIQKAASYFGVKQVVRADKTRNTETGAIAGTVVYSDHIGSKDFFIVDDICDGGRTFIELAKVLRPLTNGKIILYVTHGIFSKGLDVFQGVIDEVYCANPFDLEFAAYGELLRGSSDNHRTLQKVPV